MRIPHSTGRLFFSFSFSDLSFVFLFFSRGKCFFEDEFVSGADQRKRPSQKQKRGCFCQDALVSGANHRGRGEGGWRLAPLRLSEVGYVVSVMTEGPPKFLRASDAFLVLGISTVGGCLFSRGSQKKQITRRTSKDPRQNDDSISSAGLSDAAWTPLLVHVVNF